MDFIINSLVNLTSDLLNNWSEEVYPVDEIYYQYITPSQYIPTKQVSQQSKQRCFCCLQQGTQNFVEFFFFKTKYRLLSLMTLLDA